MLRKTKVLIDNFYHRAALAGIKNYIEELNWSIKDYGSKNISYLFTHDLKQNNNYIFKNSNFRLLRLFFHLLYFVHKQFLLPIKILILKPDYLICPDYISPFISFETKKIVVLHDSLFWNYPINYNFLWRKYFIKMIKIGIDNNTKIVTTSNYSKKNLNLIFDNNVTITTIYQSCSFVLGNDGIFEFDNYILHVGSFEKRKDLMTLIKAFYLLKKTDLKLILVGSKIFNGDESVFKEIKLFIKKNKLHNKIIMPGYVSKERLNSLYRNASLYVFPSIDEGFGIPILEASFHKIPIICSDLDVFKEIAKNSALFFKKGNHEDLCSKIKLLLSSKNIQQKLVSNGQNNLKNFSRKSFVKEFEKIVLETND